MPTTPATIRSLKLAFEGGTTARARAEHLARGALERVAVALSAAERERGIASGHRRARPVTVRLTSGEPGAAIESIAAAILDALERG